jgi:hypothetical protein
MSRRSLVLLLGAFLVTRLACAWLADHPDVYGEGRTITSDLTLYQYWGERIVHHGLVPYEQIRIEYPPGSLPFIVGPELVGSVSYQTAFIVLMLLVDAAGLVGVLRLARRWGSPLGPALWVALVPLLGPIVYVRLDMVPAVATIWAVERASRAGWLGVGAWLGFGAAAKLYPAALFPASIVLSSRRVRLVGGAALVVLLTSVPFVPVARAVVRDVLGYHLDRGIEIESFWGAVLLVASKLGHTVRSEFGFESLNVTSSASPTVKVLATVLLLATLAWTTWIAARVPVSRRDERLADVAFATLAVLVSLATVLSPQYILWVVAVGCAATCSPRSAVRIPVLLLAPVAVLTQVVYPFLFARLAMADSFALLVLVIRDLLLVVLAAWSLFLISRPVRSARRTRMDPVATDG